MLDLIDRPLDAREQRLRYLALHLDDLEFIRWVPIWLCFIALPLGSLAGRDIRLVYFISALLATSFWYWFVKRHLRARFGTTTLSAQERQRQRAPTRIYWLLYILYESLRMIFGFHHRSAAMDIILGVLTATVPLSTILDKTNLPLRRAVYASVAVVIAIGAPVLFLRRQDLLACGLIGFAFLSLGIFDYALLVHLTRLEAARA